MCTGLVNLSAVPLHVWHANNDCVLQVGQLPPMQGQAPSLPGQCQRPQNLPGQTPEPLPGQGQQVEERPSSRQLQLPAAAHQQQPAGQQGSSQLPHSPQHNAATATSSGMGLASSGMSGPPVSAPLPQVRLFCVAGLLGTPGFEYHINPGHMRDSWTSFTVGWQLINAFR